MSKHNLINISIFFIISILCNVNSQNIITSWHYDKVQMYELETIGDIFTYSYFSNTSFKDFTEDSIDIKNLKISSVSHSLYDSYFNFKTGLFLLMPNKVSFSFTFDYSYGEVSSNATFDLKLNMIKIRVKNDKEKQNPSAKISSDYSENDFCVFDIINKTITEEVKLALFKGFKNNSFVDNNILGKINLIDHYKKRLLNKENFKFITSSFLENKEIIVKLDRFIGFCEDIKGSGSNSLCYYSGEIDNKQDKTDRSNVPLKNKEFLNSTDYNIFININLLNMITEKISSEGIKEKAYDKNVAKKSLSYDFTLASLKKYFNGLDSYDDKLEFSTIIKISEFDSKSAKFNVAFTIGKKLNVFSIDIELKLEFDFSLKKNVRLNLCLKSVSDIKVNISSSTITIKDENRLKSVIEESFDYKNIPLCLSDGGISFKDYYAKILKIEATDEGFYLSGNQLYQ